MRSQAAIVVLAGLLLLGAGALRAALDPDDPPWLEVSGRALGTTWHVRLCSSPGAAGELATEIQSLLDGVDARMSTWRADSELSRFNAREATDWFPVSPDTRTVVRAALEVKRRSGGAFDPGIAPLIELWGFGPAPRRDRPPDEVEIVETLRRVAAGRFELRSRPPALRKTRAGLSLDLSGAAKGFAVDAIARRLEALGVASFLVEVGGEIRGRGPGPAGGPWRVGIERPVTGIRHIDWQVALSDASLATSGDYRNHFEWRRRRFGHVIDPRSGRPIDHGLVSVSVRAPDALHADAWATALLVLGPDVGWRVAERERLAVLFIVERNGALEARANAPMQRHRLR